MTTQRHPAVLASLMYPIFDCGYSSKLQGEGLSSSYQAVFAGRVYWDTDTSTSHLGGDSGSPEYPLSAITMILLFTLDGK